MSDGVRYRRTWPQRGLLVGCVALIGASLYSASAVDDVYDDIASITRIEFAPGVLTNPDEVDPGGPRNILLVGTTENDGIDENDPLVEERTNTFLADTIMLLRVDPENEQAQVMSINRDIWVESSRSKINAVAQISGIPGLVRVVKDLLQVPIDNVIVVNFAGFRSVVDQLGGVPVYFPYDAFDEGSFFDITAGCHRLTGEQALSYVRSRNYVQRIDGRLVADTQVDYTRTERQRDFLVLALDRAIEKGARNPTVLKRLLHTASENDALQLDTSLTPQNLIDLGQAFAGFQPENLQRTALPSTEATRNGQDVLLIDEDTARPILDVYSGNGNTLEPRQVTVQLTDARGKVTEAVRPQAALTQLGFKTTTKAAPGGTIEARTVITYSADQRQGALLLSRYLAADATYQEVTGLRTLRVTLGSDFQGVLAEPKPESELVGKFPGLTSPTTPVSPTTSAASNAAVPTTAVPASAAPTTVAPNAPTTTSGIYGRPPDGVTCS